MKPGPTGTYPQGKLNPKDEGALAIGFRVEHGKLVMEFGKEIAWFAMDKATATAMLAVLVRYVKEGR